MIGDIEINKNQTNVATKRLVVALSLSEEVCDDLTPLFKKYGNEERVVVKALGILKYLDQHMEEGWVLSLESEKENTRKEITEL